MKDGARAMSRRRGRFPRGSLFSALLLLFTLTMSPSSAARVLGEVSLGFSDTFRLGAWAPLTVRLENQGADVVGELQVRLTSGNALTDNEYQTSQTRRIELAKGAVKRFRFTVRIDSVAHPLQVRLVTGDTVHFADDVVLRERFTERHLVLALSQDADLDHLNALEGTAPSAATVFAPSSQNFSATDARTAPVVAERPLRWRVVYPHPSTLPERWAGYSGVSTVILHGVSLKAMTDRQFAAFDKWLADGGTLVVSGSPDYTVLTTPRLAELLPGLPTGLVRLTDGDEIGRVLRFPLRVARSFDINRIRLRAVGGGRATHSIEAAGRRRDGTAAESAAGQPAGQGATGKFPLIVERSYGRGKVVYFAFDISRYPFDRWRGMEKVWRSVLSGAAARQSPLSVEIGHAPPDEPVLRALRDPELAFPDHPTLIAFLVVYLGALVAAYAIAADARTARKVQVALVWLVPLGFGPVAYFVFGPMLFPAQGGAIVIGVVEPLRGSPYAAVDLDIAFYTSQRDAPANDSSRESVPPTSESAEPRGPRAATWHFSGGDPVYWPGPMAFGVESTPDWHAAIGHRPAMTPVGARGFSVHRLRGKDLIPFAFTGNVEENKQGFRVSLRNDSGFPIERAWLLIDHFAYRIGRLAPGESFDRELSPADSPVLLRTSTSWWRVVDGVDTGSTRAAVEEGLLGKKMKPFYPSEPDEAVFFGFTEAPVGSRRGAQPWKPLEMALVRAVLPRARDLASLMPRPEGEVDPQSQDETL